MHAPNPFEKQTPIKGVKNIIAVASGKGGVGKSTVATNLAMGLAKKYQVGLLDADIYGPSLPRMMGALNQKPQINEQKKLEPVTRFGVKLMSMGFLINEDSAVVWRGPMLFKAMDQFFRDVHWGDLDFLIIDLPPGTGDVQLSLVQKVPVAGAVVVTTPQNISLIDAKKAIDMFQKTNVKILGLVENMSYMINPSTQERIQMFPQGDLNSYAQFNEIEKLAEIPFNPSVGISSEAGIPIVESHPTGSEAIEFQKLADRIISRL